VILLAVVNETRSLWEQLDSEVELWRRGRLFLIGIGLYHFITQIGLILATAFQGNLERSVLVAATAVLFWLLFYCVWIGLHWIRWVWGAWNLVIGFCLLIWGWRDQSAIETVSGTITFCIGFVLCFSPSIYFFACRQRQSVRWLEAGLIGVVCFLVLLTIGISSIGLFAVRREWQAQAVTFANEANHRIYHDRDLEWVRTRVTPSSYQRHGPERLQQFFARNRAQLGEVGPISDPQSKIILYFEWPFDLIAAVRVDCTAATQASPIEVHQILIGRREEWQIERMWWEYAPRTSETPRGD
jgi:hypothetical protein